MAKKKMNLFSATALGVSAILGSGWLFAPYKTAMVAGPAALYSWLIGAALIVLLAMCFAEIAALYPIRGLTAVIPTLSHNKYFGFPFAIANWLGIVAVIALEATATIQYIISISPEWKETMFIQGEMTGIGTIFSILLVILYTLFNFWGAKFFVKANNVFAILKIVIPVVTALFILFTYFNVDNLTRINGTMAPYGIYPIFSAIISSGIIIAFNGFQTMVSFASEIHKPERTIPFALLIAILFSLVVYLLVQFAFILGMPEKELANGWDQIKMYAPMLQLSVMLGLGILAPMLYIGSTIAPTGTAIAFLGSSTRMFTAMARNEQMPKFFDKIDPKVGFSRRSLLFNMGLATVFLLVFKSWGRLAVILSLFHVIAYLPIPIALCVFRRKVLKKELPFYLPFGKSIAFVLFLCFSYLFSLADVPTLSFILILFGSLQLIFIILNLRSLKELTASIRQSIGLFIYFGGIFLFNYFSFNEIVPVIANYHYIYILLFSAIFFFIFTHQEKDDEELFKSAVTIYKE